MSSSILKYAPSPDCVQFHISRPRTESIIKKVGYLPATHELCPRLFHSSQETSLKKLRQISLIHETKEDLKIAPPCNMGTIIGTLNQSKNELFLINSTRKKVSHLFEKYENILKNKGSHNLKEIIIQSWKELLHEVNAIKIKKNLENRVIKNFQEKIITSLKSASEIVNKFDTELQEELFYKFYEECEEISNFILATRDKNSSVKINELLLFESVLESQIFLSYVKRDNSIKTDVCFTRFFLPMVILLHAVSGILLELFLDPVLKKDLSEELSFALIILINILSGYTIIQLIHYLVDNNIDKAKNKFDIHCVENLSQIKKELNIHYEEAHEESSENTTSCWTHFNAQNFLFLLNYGVWDLVADNIGPFVAKWIEDPEKSPFKSSAVNKFLVELSGTLLAQLPIIYIGFLTQSAIKIGFSKLTKNKSSISEVINLTNSEEEILQLKSELNLLDRNNFYAAKEFRLMKLQKILEKELKGARQESEVEPEPISYERPKLGWQAV